MIMCWFAPKRRCGRSSKDFIDVSRSSQSLLKTLILLLDWEVEDALLETDVSESVVEVAELSESLGLSGRLDEVDDHRDEINDEVDGFE